MANGERREQILRAAMERFSEKGYHATSMRDIADLLGIRAGSLYVHIAGKEDLLYEIVDRAAQQFLEAVDGAERRSAARDAGPEERLRRAIGAHLDVMAQNLDTATVFFHEWKFLDPERRARVRAKRDAYEGVFRRIVADGVAGGDFRDVDVRIAGLALMSLCNWFYQWYSPQGPLSAAAVGDAFADLLLAGLRAGGGGDRGDPAAAPAGARAET